MPFLKLGERGVDPNTQQNDAHEVRLCRPASDDENWWGRINCKWLLFTGIRAAQTSVNVGLQPMVTL